MKQDKRTGRILPTLSAEQRAAICEGYRSGASQGKLAKQFGIDQSSVWYILHRAGVEIRRYHKLTGSQQAAVIVEYKAGTEIPALAEKYGIDQSCIWTLLRRRKVPMRSRSKACRTYEVDESSFDVLTDDVAYWVGFLMADGCVKLHSTGSWYVSLGLAETDRGHVKLFRSFLRSTHPIRVERRGNSPHNTQPLHVLTIASKRMADRLISLGVVPRKSEGATVCAELAMNRHFWRGAVDGDGFVCISGKTNHTRADVGLVGSRPLVGQFSLFVQQAVGHRAPVRPVDTIWGVRMASRFAEALAHVLYDDAHLALPRKAAMAVAIFERAARISKKRARWPHIPPRDPPVTPPSPGTR